MKWINIVLPFAMAVFAAYVGATAKVFYPGRLGGPPRDKPIPKWFGRLWFFGGSAVCFYWSITNFLHR
jgi:hypothetical protein